MKCYKCGKETAVLYRYREVRVDTENSTDNCEVVIIKNMLLCKDCNPTLNYEWRSSGPTGNGC